MQVPQLDLTRAHRGLEVELLAAAEKVILSGRYALGEEVSGFEAAIAELSGAAEAVAVNSGTDALNLALMAAGIGSGAEVVTTPFTFFATVEAILAVGARPVFVDIDPGTFNVNPQLVERALTARTRALLPVHLFGHPADMPRLEDVAEAEGGLLLIEDCAQAVGASLNGVPVGSFGDLAAFSFYPTKNLGALGDAGAVVTRYPDYAAAVRRLRNHGQSAPYHHDTRGLNSRMDELQAAFLNVKLRRLSAWNQERRKLAATYGELLAGISEVETPTELAGCYHVYHQYAVRVGARDDVLAELKEAGIGATVYYPVPLHLMKVLSFLGHKPGDFPEAERAAREVLCLPIYPGLTAKEQDYVAEHLKRAVKRHPQSKGEG
ncbi:MAG: hypothetical protein B1H03_05780 [Planctomycetales bacterium 4484_113]|nr:MAG: hypothetical protein B1H03_05780 [Planctomycetales bacterium 4484_113]